MQKISITSLIILICGIILVILSYFFIDKPIAYFVYKHPIILQKFILQITHIPAIIIFAIVPIIIIGGLIYMTWKPLNKLFFIFFAIAINLSVVYNIKNTLKWIFGRTWPLPWVGHTPSLINSHTLGFHFFHGGVGYAAFPSGHATILATMITTLWVFYPKWRWIYIIFGLVVILSLLALNYHFASDIIGGITLGTIFGLYANYLIKLHLPKN